MKTVILILLAAAGGVGPTSVSRADENAVIVFGFEDYQHLPDLPKQADELRAVVDVLQGQCRFSKISAVTDNPESLRTSDANLVAHSQFSESVEWAINNRVNRLLIYISGHVLENQAGEVSLAVPETDPTQPDSAGIPVEEISNLLQAVPRETAILLFIDCGKPGADGQSVGVAGTRVLDALKDIKNLVGFAACSEGQQSYSDPDTRRSLFADAVSRAFSGAADQNENQIVSAKELFRFLFRTIQANVATLGVEQTPVIQTTGTIQNDIELLPYVKQSPEKSIRLVNRESGATAIVYVREKDIGQLKLGPGETKVVEFGSIADIEFYTGTPEVGVKGWRSLMPAPADIIEFRMAQQMNQTQAWTAGFTNSLGMNLTLVYPGQFKMGRNEGDDIMFRASGTTDETYNFGLKAELPSHTVELSSPVYVGSHEVTVDQFRSFVQRAAYRSDAEKQGYQNQAYIDGTGTPTKTSGLSWHSPGFDQIGSHPVVHVTWNDADRFCRWLSLREMTNYSLPTEAQWEYAARAGTQTAYWNSNDPERLTEIANIRDATAAAKFPKWTDTSRSRDGFVFTAPVGQFRTNPFGLHDVHGNVWEWCADWYDEGYYRSSPRSDPAGPDTGDERVYRGGCFY
jgi:sulfatase modifying factor 1